MKLMINTKGSHTHTHTHTHTRTHTLTHMRTHARASTRNNDNRLLLELQIRQRDQRVFEKDTSSDFWGKEDRDDELRREDGREDGRDGREDGIDGREDGREDGRDG